jgi:hypothetical protein
MLTFFFYDPLSAHIWLLLWGGDNFFFPTAITILKVHYSPPGSAIALAGREREDPEDVGEQSFMFF